MDAFERKTGLTKDGQPVSQQDGEVRRLILLKLAAMGFEVPPGLEADQLLELGRDLFARHREQSRLLSEHLNPADQRIQTFLDRVCADLTPEDQVKLTPGTFVLDRNLVARELCFPDGVNVFENGLISSYRTANGVMHNPVNDRRTTKGVFHVADVGLPVPADKRAVPLVTYARLLSAAFRPPAT